MNTVRCRPSSRSIGAGQPRAALAGEQPLLRGSRRRARRPRRALRRAARRLRRPATNQRSRRARALRRSRQPLMRMRVNQTSNGQASRYDADVREHLDERVLHGFVGLDGVAQVLIGDARRAPLVQRRRARRTARAPRPSRRARPARGSRPRAASPRTAGGRRRGAGARQWPPRPGPLPRTASTCGPHITLIEALRCDSSRLFTVYCITRNC